MQQHQWRWIVHVSDVTEYQTFIGEPFDCRLDLTDAILRCRHRHSGIHILLRH
ncbi:hypothetical protein ACWDSL_30060 [Streptomyces sp. NPDC000941]